MDARTPPAPGLRRAAATLWLVLVAILAAVVGAPEATAAPARPVDVVLVTYDCADNFLCRAFTRALRATGARGRIIAPDSREDPADTIALLARQDLDLVIVSFGLGGELVEVAARFPETRFALYDEILPRGAPRNTEGVVLRPHEAAYLAGWLAARMERRRPGPDVIGAVGGVAIPPVDDFIVGYRAGALRASPGVTVLTDYSDDFLDANRCEAIARRQIARGAGTVFNVAGGCGIGTLRAARRAGVWAVGVDSDQSGRGPHILTSVVKRYDVGLVRLLRQAQARGFAAGRTIELGLAERGAGLGRISPRVPSSVRAELARVRRAILRGDIRVPGVAPIAG